MTNVPERPALRDMPWCEAEPIYRAFHGGKPICSPATPNGRVLDALYDDTDYWLPEPQRLTVNNPALWTTFPNALAVTQDEDGYIRVWFDLLPTCKSDGGWTGIGYTLQAERLRAGWITPAAEGGADAIVYRPEGV